MTTHRLSSRLAFVALLLALLLPPRTHADGPPQVDPSTPMITPSAEVGTLAAQFAVTDAGSATYAIPLELPAGTNGMAPALGLHYDSAAGSGSLGVGWSLAGLSSISRCSPNLALDGRHGPISFTSEDALCLDGERLVVVEGNAWQSGVVYAKRHDDLTRVRLIASSACPGMMAFEVRSTDDRIHQYGCREDALVRTKAGVLAWARARSSDRFGNTIDYRHTYDEVDGTRVDHRISHIEYGGHEGAPELEHDTRVSMLWEPRPDASHGWFRGMPTAATQRLRAITVRRGDELVRSWPLTYEQGETTGRSRLVAVRECAADGACKPATQFDWIEGELELDDMPFRGWSFDGSRFPYMIDPNSSVTDQYIAAMAQVVLDANGDGMSDLMAAVGEVGMFMVEGRGWELWRSQPHASALLPEACGAVEPLACQAGNLVIDEGEREAFLSFAVPEFLDHIPQSSFAIDADGDGRDDMVSASAEGLLPTQPWAIGKLLIASSPSEGEVVDRVLTIGWAGAPAWIYAAADLSGDGLGDLVWCAAHDEAEHDARIGTWRVLLNSPEAGLDEALAVDSGERCSAHDKLHVLDHDGDGVHSLLVVRTWDDDTQSRVPASKWQDYHAFAFSPELDTFAWTSTGLPPDLAQRWRVSLDSPSFENDFPTAGAALSHDRVLDVQGDGLPDILRYQLLLGDAPSDSPAIIEHFGPFDDFNPEVLAGLNLWINDGTDFHDAGFVTIGAPGNGLWEEFQASNTIDHDADGRLDLLMARVSDEVWRVWSFEALSPLDIEIDMQPLLGAPSWQTSGSKHPHALASLDVDGDGLHDPIFWDWSEEQFWDIRRHRGEAPDRIRQITDGLGRQTRVEYASITDFEAPDLYEAETCTWPHECQARAQVVVSRHFADAGGLLSQAFEHHYAGSRGDRLERRWLGFATHEVTQSILHEGQWRELGRRTISYDNAAHDETLATSPRAGVPARELEQRHDVDTGERFAELREWGHAIVPTGPQSFRVVATSSRTRTFEPATCFGWCSVEELIATKPLTHAWTSVEQLDALGFPLIERGFVDLGAPTHTVERLVLEQVVEHDPDAWLLGRVTHESLTDETGDEPVTRTRSLAYDPSSGALVQDVEAPDDPDLQLTTQLEHDAFGNVITETLADAWGEARTTATTYDERGRFPSALTNALGHVTRVHWHAGLSRPHTVADPNGVRQVLDVDGFGRTTGVRVFAGGQSRGDDVSISYQPRFEGMQIHTSIVGHGQRTVEIDGLGRPIAERWLGPEGLEREQRTHYDVQGRVASIDAPRFVGDAPIGSETWAYDLRGRPTMHTRVDGAFERWFYAGLMIEHRDFVGETARRHFDGAGRLFESERAPGLPEHERICFDYGAFAQLEQVREDCIAGEPDMLAPPPGEALPRVERFAYDLRGRVVWTDNPSQGERLHGWTAFDELAWTFDASDRFVEFEYDALGRTLVRIDDDGVSSWLWDLERLGTLGAAIGPTGVVTSHAFDAFARPIALRQEIEGESFEVRLDYDAHDRVRAIHYPQVDALPAFAVRNLYGQDGSLVGVRRLADDQPIWQLDEVDVESRVVRESFANGTATTRSHDAATGLLLGIHTSGPKLVQDLRYTWSDAGQLLAREDLRGDQLEEFAYDPLHRLVLARAQRGASVHERHFAYDTLGNLVHATDVGDYAYAPGGQLLHADDAHQQWDPSGNLVLRSTPEVTHRFEWTSFDKLAQLTPSEGEPTLFEYDAEQQRVRRHDLDAQLDTIVAFGFYERDRETTDEGKREVHRHHVFGRDRIVAELAIEIDPEGIVSERTRYLHDDHLGSLDVITDEQGAVVQRLAHDAWGKPRDADDWTVPDEFVPELLVNRGYTGHAARRDAGLIDMGGRLYDPRVGRMVNADPFVVDPETTLGWNRYAYVLDDPLSLTDPSGFFPDIEIEESEGAGGKKQRTIYIQNGFEATLYVIAPREGAGSTSDAGPDVDTRGDAGPSDSGLLGFGIGVFDGVGNTGYMAGTGVATYFLGPAAGVGMAIGFWASGGNPVSEVRQFVGELIGSEVLSADPSGAAYQAGLISGEVISGGLAGAARGVGSGVRALVVSATRRCAVGGCGRAGFGGRLAAIVMRTSCFVAGTPVALPDGSTRPIEQIEVGDEVACFDAQGPAVCVVAETSRREVALVLEVAVEDESGERSTITVTPEHPFHVVELGRWLDADDLRVGHTLLRHDGTHARVLGLEAMRGEFEVYNFESLDAHDYFAGELLVLVHNGCSKRLARNMQRATGVARPDGYATHHIVAGGAKRAKPAQQVLERFGIHIDDAANGVYLPNSVGAARASGAVYHRGLHSNAYYDKVNLIMEQAATKEEAISRLADIAADLVQGTF